MLNLEFTINLTEPIKPGKVTIGYFDGVHPSIVAVTRSDKIFVHNPHNRSIYSAKPNEDSGRQDAVVPAVVQFSTTSGSNDLNFLNINQTITCLAAGPISTNQSASVMSSGGPNTANSSSSNSFQVSNRSAAKSAQRRSHSGQRKSLLNNDILVVGTNTSVHVYDILQNTDLYYKEIPDGGNVAVIGSFGQVAEGNIALVGGNCAIHGFDRDGNDSYWMVTGDNITAMALVDVDDDNQNELIVGSEDCEIQVFKKDAILVELHETDQITCLCALGPQLFAYALANGTVGVYRTNGQRLWRIKSKNQAVTLFGADMNHDGQVELLTGWSNGKLDIRLAHTGEVMYRENFKCSIAGIMIADYNMDGKEELIVCTVAGEVYGYRLGSQEERHQVVNSNLEQETIRELMKRKQTLLQELRNYEENARVKNLPDPLVMNRGKVLNEKGDYYGAIPANTKIKSSLVLKRNDDDYKGLIQLILETTNNTEIRAAVVFAEGIFKHESTVVYPSDEEVSNKLCVPICPPKDTTVDLHVKVLVGYRASSHYHVFELSRHLPRFSMYGFVRYFPLKDVSNDQISMPFSIDEEDEEMTRLKTNYQSVHSEKLFESKLEIDDEPLEGEEEEGKFKQIYNSYGYVVFDKKSKVNVTKPNSHALIRLTEPLSRVIEWINSNFLLDLEIELNEEERCFEFVSLRNPSNALVIELSRLNKTQSEVEDSASFSLQNPDQLFDGDDPIGYDTSNVTNKANTRTSSRKDSVDQLNATLTCSVIIYSNSMEVAGSCIQSIGDFLGIENLPCSKAHFPEEIGKLKQLVDRVEEIQSVRQHLVVEVADSANLVRSAVVQAEDARLTEDYKRMKQIYNDLSMLNRDIFREHKIRCQNHQDLVDSLKQINVIIQRASNLRIGTYRTVLINACREAIKQKNFVQLFKIISED